MAYKDFIIIEIIIKSHEFIDMNFYTTSSVVLSLISKLYSLLL